MPADVPTVRVPATSANLGPGFDSMGLALDLWDEVSATPADHGPSSVEVSGVGAATVPRDGSNLILQSMHTAWLEFGIDPQPVRLTCRNRIPQARGLGSSAAAICAGLMLAREIGSASLDDGGLLDLASRIEGHPDNVAACLLGGLTVAWSTATGIDVVRLDARGFTPVLLIPATESSTEQTRGLLPEAVPHADATFNAARAALLVTALTGHPCHLLEATEDRLHQPYRAAAMPASAALVRELRNASVPAVISGAGPSVLALCRDQAEVTRAEALAPDGWEIVVTAVAGAAPDCADARSWVDGNKRGVSLVVQRETAVYSHGCQ